MKKTLYPKTSRFSDNKKVIITEKLDGSNLGIFKYGNELYIAQRNYLFKAKEIDKKFAYKGLIGWITEHYDELLDNMQPNSGVFGEWIGMGKLKYPDLDKRFYMFAKFNVTLDGKTIESIKAKNIYYDRGLFIYPFITQEIPDFIGVVPKVHSFDTTISLEKLDDLYETYKEKIGRDVEGFISINNNVISKYVRHKNGKETEHKF